MYNALQHKLIGLVITYNEAKNIPSLFETLHFVDEIIVIDSFSTDETAQIVASYPKATLYQHKFQDYATQRNIALEYVKGNWVLFLDADERISESLKKEIIATVNHNKTSEAYFFKRRFFFNNKPVYFGGLQTDKNVRLFYNHPTTHYQGLVHEKLQFNGHFKVLKNFLTHFSYEDYATYKEKMLRYGVLKGREKIRQGKYPNPVLKYVHPAYTFICKFLIRGGILDGNKGFVLSYLMAFSVYIRYQEMELLSRQKNISSQI